MMDKHKADFWVISCGLYNRPYQMSLTFRRGRLGKISWTGVLDIRFWSIVWKEEVPSAEG